MLKNTSPYSNNRHVSHIRKLPHMLKINLHTRLDDFKDPKSKIDDKTKNELKEEIKNELEKDLKCEIGDKTKNELKEEIKNELKKDLKFEIGDKTKGELIKEVEEKIDKELRIKLNCDMFKTCNLEEKTKEIIDDGGCNRKGCENSKKDCKLKM